MKGPFGNYGRYDDAPGVVGCPRAKSDMTPCAARDGACACCENGECVGCGKSAAELLKALVFEMTAPQGAEEEA